MSTTHSKLIINKTEVVAENGLVTAMHPLAAEAGAEILQQGGNAADAAVAAAFAVGVVEPFMSGLGGAAYVVAHNATTGQTLTLDGAVELPQAATADMFALLDPDVQGLGVYGWRGTKDNAAETGYRSVAIPGAVATYATLLERFGTMPLAEVLIPAIRLASEGFPMDWYVFANSAISMARLQAFPHTIATFFKTDGSPYKPSMIDDVLGPERLIQPELAQTLRLIAEQGPDVFYRGEIGQLIAQHLNDHGGLITTTDLANYQVRERDPLWIDYRGKRVAFISRNSGGMTVAQMLNILAGFDLAALGHNSAAALHLIAEAQHMAYADRFAYLGDPDFAEIPLEVLESKTYAEARRTEINVNGPPITEAIGDPWPFRPTGRPANFPLTDGRDAADQHTTHLTVVDRDRNVVSLTASLGQLFGSGIVVPGTGVTLNNGMMWFDPEPGRVNSIGPGKRALHAGTPAIVFDGARPFLALGSPGGRKVLTAVQQIIHNVVDFGLGMQDAVSAPRIHCENGLVNMDIRLPAETIEAVRAIGHEVAVREEHFLSSYFARPNAILIDRDEGVLRSGLEPYKLSTAVGF